MDICRQSPAPSSGVLLLVSGADSDSTPRPPISRPMLLRLRASGFIEPCLPTSAERPPSGPNWIHEIKHDEFRLMARRDPVGIRLLTRNGNDWAPRYPLIFEAVNRLKVRSCLIEGEAVACNGDGVPVFESCVAGMMTGM